MPNWLKRILDLPEKSIGYFLVTGVLLAAAWVGTHVWETVVQAQRQKNEWELAYVSRQISELYGPLYFLVAEGREAWQNFQYEFHRDFRRSTPFIQESETVFTDDSGARVTFPVLKPLTRDEQAMWDYWKDHEFMPRNRKIQELLKAHPDLIVGQEVPPSYGSFLAHYQAWEIDEQRRRDTGVPYSGMSRMNWPYDFEIGIINSYKALKARQMKLVRSLRGSASGSK